MARRLDLLVGATVSAVAHATVLAALAGRGAPTHVSLETAPSVHATEVVSVGAEQAAVLLSPTVAPRLPDLRAPAHAAPPAELAREVPAATGAPLALPDLSPLPAPGLSSAAAHRPGHAVERLAPLPAPAFAPSSDEAPPEIEGTAAEPAAQLAREEVASADLPRADSAVGLVVRRAPLAYPREARRRREEGVVTIGIEVARDGTVARAWVLASSGSGVLDRAARANVEAWRFDPRAVEALGRGHRFRQDVHFSLP